MGLVGGWRLDPSFSAYAGIVCLAKGHDDNAGLSERALIQKELS
jgi:hypothetical protein